MYYSMNTSVAVKIKGGTLIQDLEKYNQLLHDRLKESIAIQFLI